MQNKPRGTSKYGEDHKKARQERIDMLSSQQCEVTGEEGTLNAHHNVPRLFNGPDHASNYVMLDSHFHQQVLHHAVNVNDPKLVGERVRLTNALIKHLLDDEKRPQIHQAIKQLDHHLIAEYVENMMNKLAYHYRERVIELTLQRSFETIRDLTIENTLLKKKLSAVEGEVVQ